MIEWKYVEQYIGHRLSGGESSMQVRYERYRSLFEHPGSPIRTDIISYDAFFSEPLYQLMRQQLLGWQMELAGELDAKRVRNVVIAPSLNHELSASYDQSLTGILGVPTGTGVHTLWRKLLRVPDRFVFIDSANLVRDSSPGSAEFKLRYGHVAGSGTSQAVAGEPPPPGAVATAASRALTILQRVAGESGVLAQVARLGASDIARMDPWLVRRLVDRLESVAEDVRRLRAEEVAQILKDPVD